MFEVHLTDTSGTQLYTTAPNYQTALRDVLAEASETTVVSNRRADVFVFDEGTERERVWDILETESGKCANCGGNGPFDFESEVCNECVRECTLTGQHEYK